MGDDRAKPEVHIFADTQAALVRMRETAETAECRIISAGLIEKGVDPPDQAILGAAILIELEEVAAGEMAMPLLGWLQGEAERGARRGMVSAPFALIDLVAAAAGHSAIVHLCQAEEGERVAAIARAFGPHRATPPDKPVARLLQPSPDYAADRLGPSDATFIRTMLQARRLRGDYLETDLFADPVWDMLLDLMAAQLEGKKVAVSSLCIASAVPPTTALRWIGVMADQGLIVRTADPKDRRRAHVALGAETARGLGAWLARARRMAAEVV